VSAPLCFTEQSVPLPCGQRGTIFELILPAQHHL